MGVLGDTLALRKRLLLEAAAYSDVLIELGLSWAKQDIYILTDDASDGFIVVVTYPHGSVSVTLDACSFEVACQLLEMKSEVVSFGCKVKSEKIAKALAAKYGYTVCPSSESVIHYATDTQHFEPSTLDAGSIRRLEKEEVGCIHAFVSEEEELKGESGRFADIEERLNSGKSIVYIANQNGKDVGYIEINEAAQFTPLWEVDFVYMTPSMRRYGIGKQLLSIATKEVLDNGLVPLYTIDADNISSKMTCESVGYYKCLDRWSLEPRAVSL